MENKTLFIILGGIAGLFLLLKKKQAVAVAPEELPGRPAVAKAQIPAGCEEKAIALAERRLGLPREELTVRGLRAQDLGLTTFSLNLAAVGWNTGAINTTVADNRFICLTGISYSGTAAESVRVTAGARRVAEFSIERVPGITSTHHIDIRPILIEQNQPVRVDVYASAVSATDNVIFEGTVIEKRGMVLA